MRLINGFCIIIQCVPVALCLDDLDLHVEQQQQQQRQQQRQQQQYTNAKAKLRKVNIA